MIIIISIVIVMIKLLRNTRHYVYLGKANCVMESHNHRTANNGRYTVKKYPDILWRDF